LLAALACGIVKNLYNNIVVHQKAGFNQIYPVFKKPYNRTVELIAEWNIVKVMSKAFYFNQKQRFKTGGLK
jgi:hypothetical protein